MYLLIMIFLFVLLLGPLRSWFVRHWAFTTSLILGAIIGFIAGEYIITRYDAPRYLQLITTITAVLVFIEQCPELLRHIEKDGK